MTETLRVTALVKHFRSREGLLDRALGHAPRVVRAVDGVSFAIGAGETLGLVGESGSGKSTVGRLILRLEQPDAGEIHLAEEDLGAASAGRVRALRRELQVVFQDPLASLNPRRTVGQAVAEPLENYGLARGPAARAEAARLLERVGLRADQIDRFPHEFSGGQRQRIGIARAIALRPKLIVLDEPVSALDVSIQAQVVNLLADLQQDYGVAYLFIAHDLAVVEHLSARVAVMYLGKLMEIGPRAAVFARPRHPYTRALLAAAPSLDPDAPPRPPAVKGDIPSPANPPSGCRFHTRCPNAQPLCAEVEPPLLEGADGHAAACHFPLT